MNIQALAQAIKDNFVSGGGSGLSVPAAGAQSVLQSQDIASLITTYLTGDLILTAVQPPSVTTTTVTYSGTISFLQQSFPADAIFYLVKSSTDGTPELTLALKLPDDWTFSQTYTALKDQVIDQLKYDQPRFVLESYASDQSGTYPNLQQGLNFSGTPKSADTMLAPVKWLLSTDLLLTGILENWSDPATTAPTMTLATPSTATSLTIGTVVLSTWLEVQSAYVISDSKQVLETSIDVKGSVGIGSGEQKLLTLTMALQKDPDLLTFSLDANTALDSLADLSGLVAGDSLANMVPAQYPLSRILRLDELSIVVAPELKVVLNLTFGITLLQSSQSALMEATAIGPHELGYFSPMVGVPRPHRRDGSNTALMEAQQIENEPTSPTWVIVPDFISLSDIFLRFQVVDPLHPKLANVYATIGATFWIGETYPIAAQITLPDVTVSAYLLPGKTIPLAEVLAQFGFQPPDGFVLDVTRLQMNANPSYKTFDLGITLDGNVTLFSFNDGKFNLTLQSITLDIARSQTGFSGQFIAYSNFAQTVDFLVSAQRLPGADATWIFSAEIIHPFSVGQLIENVTGWQPPDFVMTMNVTEFGLSYNTGEKTFSLNAGLDWLLEDLSVEIDLLFKLQSSNSPTKSLPSGSLVPGGLPADVLAAQALYSGSLDGDFAFMGLTLTLVYAFDQANQTDTYTLKVGFITATFSDPAKGDKILQFSFGNTTLGDIIVFLIKLVDPGASSHLGAPWSALDSIDLANLSITINFTQKFFEIDYTDSFDLGFLTIDNIGLRYTRNYGQGQVQLNLQGSLLGQPFGKDNPLSWDVLNGQPPALPGAGSKLLDLQYVGVGQHVTLNVRGLASVSAVIEALEKTVVPLTNTSKNPLDQVGGLYFSSSSNWLFGTKFVILETFALSVVFLDPEVYGLLIDVNGAKGGIFQGLSFEILYRKVTDTIGVYHIELKLPDAMRHLEFGQVSLTLPIVILDIYTNGNFRIDFGFPISLQDFSNSFAIEVFPFVGSGGFYFALLDGATSSRVPVIDNGSFNPVIEFGFALSVGVGKTLTLGPLSAGVSVTVIGMLQGAFGWFHPTEESTPSATYYWIQGTAAIVGQVYGTVDFVVIKASVSLTVYASITLTVEAYEPITIYMQAGVSVEVSLKILFITLHFSFSATITLTFTIGSASTPPWHVAQEKPRTLQMRSQLSLHSAAPRLAARAFPYRKARLRFPKGQHFSFAAAPSVAQAPTLVQLMLTPVISQALPKDFLPTASGNPPLATCNVLLFVRNAIDPTAVTARQASVPAADAGEMPFNALVQKLLTWAIQFIGKDTGDTVTSSELEQIHEQLSDPNVIARTFSYNNLKAFFTNYKITFEIDLRPSVPPPDGQVSASFFPMLPELTLNVGSNQVPFWSTHPVDNDYVTGLSAYFDQLMVDYENSVEQDPQQTGATARQPKTLAMDGESPTSMAGYLFCAYFALLTRATVQNAVDYLKSYIYTVTDAANTSLSTIATGFSPATAEYIARHGDSLVSVAAQLAMPVHFVTAANSHLDAQARLKAGTRLAVSVGVTAESIVTANQSTTGLFGTTPLQLTNVVYQVKAADTFTSIASSLSFAGGTALDPVAIISFNADSAAILQTGSSFPLPTLNYTGKTGDTLDNVALYFNVPSSQVSQNGLQFTISGVTHTVQGGFVINYACKAGDSLDGVIQYFFGPLDGSQLPAYERLLQNWNLKVDFSTALAPGTEIQIPCAETLNNIARYYYPNVASSQQLQTLAPAVVSQQILAPLAMLAVAAINYVAQVTDSFLSIAQKFNFTLAELSSRIEGQLNLFPAATKFTIPNVPAIKVADLVTGVGNSPQTNSTAASTSRFLLQGLRLPYPSMTSSTYPLYSLTAQSFPLPSPLPAISLGVADAVPWIQFAGGGNSIALSFTQQEQDQIAAFRTLSFAPRISWVGRLPLFNYQPSHFTVQTPLHWQAAQLPLLACLSSQGISEPTVWALPATLQQRIANASGAELQYALQVNSYRDASSGLQTNAVGCYAWATAVDLEIKQITALGGAASMPNAYLMAGADDTGQQTLFDLLTYLQSPAGKSDAAQLMLLYAPNPSGSNPKGVASDQLSVANTFVLQTNLSTESGSGAAMAYAARGQVLAQHTASLQSQGGQQVFAATIDQAGDFLSLVWEAGVVKNGGYFLNYANSAQNGLPGYLFSQGTEATITLLVLLNSQTQSGAALLPFNNVVVVGDSIDASSSDVFATPVTYQVKAGDTLQSIATVLAGYGMSVPALALANQTIQNLLQVGQTLNINPSTPYVVQYGDTLASIAQAHPPASVAGIGSASAGLAIFTVGATMQLSGAQTYVVQLNDSLQGVVQKLNVPGLDVAALAEANQWNAAFLQPNAELNLTSTTTYTIRPGDTLASIAMSNPPGSVKSIAVASQGLAILVQGALAFYGPSQLEMHAAVPAGSTAFQLWRSYLAGDANQQQLNLMFNLLGYRLAQNSNFNASNEGVPAGPQKETNTPPDQPEADVADNSGVLYYKQVLAFNKSANTSLNPVPNTPALPSQSAFPYAGILTAAGQAGNAVVQAVLEFHDLSGSLTNANPAPSLPPLPVGYTDDLIGLTQWHGVTATFDFPSAAPQLQVTAVFSMEKYLPDFGQSYQSSQQSARAHHESYTSLYYQIQEPGLAQFALSTSIGELDVSLASRQQVQLSLMGLAEQIYLFLAAAKDLQQVFPPLTAGTELGAVATTYATTVAAIMSANKTVELSGQWFGEGTALNVPNFYIVKTGDTLTVILKQVTVAQLQQNDLLPLNAGTGLVIPSQPYQVDAKSTASLIQISNSLYTTVIDLAGQNGTVNLTASTLTFSLGGFSLPVTSADTLETMATKFNQASSSLDATPASVAIANQTVEGIFQGQPLTYTAYVVQQGDSLATVAAQFKTDDSTIIDLNLQTANVFPSGTAIYLSGADTSYTLQEGDTFDLIATGHGISIDEFGARNAGAVLLAMNQSPNQQFLAIPDAVQLPSHTPYYSSYLAAGGSETFADIIGKYAGWDAPGFVTLNQNLPGLFVPQQLPNTSVTPKFTDTLVMLAEALNLTPLVFLQRFETQANILRSGALLLCPPLQTSAGATLSGMAQNYRLASPLALAQANSALLGLVATPQTISYTYSPPNGQPVTKQYSVSANNTLATVVTQFNLLFGLTTLTLEDIVGQNPSISLAANQVVIPPVSPATLPPLTVTLSASYPDAVFPMTVDLQILRNRQWVDPDFQNDTSVFFNTAPITASPLAAGAAPLSLSLFAANFEKAFASSLTPFRGLKLGTGESESGGTSSKPRLWVVNLDPARNGIEFSVDAGRVKFYGLEPLSNQLWRANGISIPTYTSGQGLEWNQTQDFQNVELDAWLSILLSAIDLVLSPQYALAVFALGSQAQSLLFDILTAKEGIAKGLRGLVNFLFQGDTGDLSNAREALYQQALTALSSVYAANVLVQFPFTVRSPFKDQHTCPLFSGKAVAQSYQSNGGVTNSTLVTHALQSGDTFASIANRFGITVIELVTANKNVPNVFEPTSTVTVLVNGAPVAVTANNGDSLSTIAEKVYGPSMNNDGLQRLAVALWSIDVTRGQGGAGYTLHTNPAVGSQPTILEYVELLPVASFSTAKLPLSQGQSSVTFLLTVQNPEQRRMAFCDIEYAVNKLEYNVQLPSTPVASGIGSNYVESSWLTFINPLDAVAFGQVQIPIPLRAFPSLPVLSGQSAVASHPGSPDLVKAKQWDYEFVLNNQLAAQDSMELGAFFNITGTQAPTPPTQLGAAKKPNPALYAALAQFMAVQAPLMSDMALLASAPANSAVMPALQAFHDLVKNVSTAWLSPPTAFDADVADDGEIHWYRMDTIINEQVADQFQYLQLSGATDDNAPLWPTINGDPYTLQFGQEALYAYNEQISQPLDLGFAMDELDAIQRQNGWSGVLVVRNQNLLGDPEVQTNPDFVYQTQLTLFANKITPYLLIEAYAPLSAGAGSDPVGQLAQSLAAFFTVVFNLDTDHPAAHSFQIKAQARYSFALVSATAEVSQRPGVGLGDELSIMTSIPLTLNPLATFDPATDADPTNPESFVCMLAAACLGAAQNAGVAAGDGSTIVPGVYVFDFSIYSSLPTTAGATTLSKPILEIRNRYWESPQ